MGNFFSDLFGGGNTTTTVVQQSDLDKLQSQLLAQLAPFILQSGQQTMPLQTQQDVTKLTGMNTLLQQLFPQLSSAATGAPTAQQQQNASNVQQQQRKQASNMGIRPGDPRMANTFAMTPEMLTKPNPDFLNTILQLFGGGQGMNAQGTMGMMHGPNQGQSTTGPSANILDYAGTGMQGLGTYMLMSKLLGGGAGAGTLGTTAGALGSTGMLSSLGGLSGAGAAGTAAIGDMAPMALMGL